MILNRRTFLTGAGAGLLLAGRDLHADQAAKGPLPVLPLSDLTGLDPDIIPLRLAASTHDFGTGERSTTFGINADYLGPVLQVKSGQTLPFAVENGLDEPVALHWHGLHIPGHVDGGPHQEIAPGDVWRPDVPIRQRSSMTWFHSHTHGRTARQVYHGLAGVLLIEDDASLAADLPQTYGVDDFTLILQDKAFDEAGRLTYELTGEVFEDGFEAETLVVNGAIAPVMQNVPAGLVRLRILNACNARFLDLSLSNSEALTVIASDGGFLASAVETATLTISPGERYEVLIDLSTSENVTLQVTFSEGEAEGLAILTQPIFGDPKMAALILNRDPSLKAFDGSMPKALANLAPPRETDALRSRDFELNMGDEGQLAALAEAWGNFCGEGGMGINGQPMQMERIDVKVTIGELEIWRISADDMQHPFHIHGCSFRILRQYGDEPPAYAQGWKDMVAVQDGVSEVLVRFDHKADETTPFMYHCHILEHEDCGMMGQFTVS
ncbi:MAG: multicopper oxidase domain-containing protein [Pseudomonadota bacterium]